MMRTDYIMDIGLPGVEQEDLQGNGWAIIHLTPGGAYLKGLQYVEDNNFLCADYIPRNDIKKNDIIMYGKVEDCIFYR